MRAGRKVIFRAEGNSRIGLGHVIRSLALAEMLRPEFDCVFAIREIDPELLMLLKATCSDVILLPPVSATGSLAGAELGPYISGDEIVVLDGYDFGTDYQNKVKESGCKLVCIDDLQQEHFVADAVINHTGGLHESNYSAEPYTRLFLGTEYALLRPPFLQKSREKKQPGSLHNLFLNMGGADPRNLTCQVLQELQKTERVHSIHVVTGLSYLFRNELNKLIGQDKRIYHHADLTAADMAALMQTCGMAICPPSSVCFEFASIGGLLFLKEFVANQAHVKSYFQEKGMAFDYERDFQQILSGNTHQAAKKMIAQQHLEFDGLSGERLLAVFQSL